MFYNHSQNSWKVSNQVCELIWASKSLNQSIKIFKWFQMWKWQISKFEFLVLLKCLQNITSNLDKEREELDQGNKERDKILKKEKCKASEKVKRRIQESKIGEWKETIVRESLAISSVFSSSLGRGLIDKLWEMMECLSQLMLYFFWWCSFLFP